jgi:DNA-binding winged helix-turn-helix (wHTH) protein/tetratricopeptide (TPR) repeat protein
MVSVPCCRARDLVIARVFCNVIPWDMKLNKYRFSVFTFDLPDGTLRRNNRSLRVPPQTLLLLTALLDRPGAVVTREELRRVLWPDGDVLGHDHAINRAVNYLRSVLRDNPKEPQFIETVPKRGYRFVASVTCIDEDVEPPLTEAQETGVYEQTAQGSMPLALADGVLAPTEVEAPIENMAIEAGALALPSVELSTPAIHRRPGLLRRVAAQARRSSIVYAASAILVAALAIALAVTWHRAGNADGLTMGILPFEASGSEAPQLAGALRADLTDTLSQMPGLQVHAFHSLDGVRQDDPNLQALAKSLHLDLLLLAKLTVEDNQCVLKLELVRSRDAVHIASLKYTDSLQGLVALRNNAQRDIFSKLHLGWDPAQVNAGSTENFEAYHDYLRGWNLSADQTVASRDEALALYQSAIQHDPGFARAYAGIASAYLNLARLQDPVENLREAKMFAERAQSLNPHVAEAHAVLGWVAIRRDWNTALCETEMRAAVDLEPNEASYHALLAECLGYAGRGDEALREIDLARYDDPLWSQINGMDIFVSGVARQYGRGVEVAWRNVAERPNSASARELLAWSLFDAGRYDEAVREWREMAVMEKDDARVALEDKGLVELHRGGPKAYAEVRLSAIEHHLDLTRSHPGDFVPEEWYAYVGDRDHAIAALEEAVNKRVPSAVNMAVNPMLDNLHGDSRFLSILTRVGLSLPVTPQGQALRASLNN